MKKLVHLINWRTNKAYICLSTFLLALLIVSMMIQIVPDSKPFQKAITYFLLIICAIMGADAWLFMQRDDRGSAIFTIICSIILPLTLLFICHSWLVNILGFYIFVLSGLIAASEIKVKSPSQF